MRIETIPVHSDNYAYLVICEQSGLAAAVDPADPRPVLDRCTALGVELHAIWNTHHHWDHVSGNEALCAARPGLTVCGHAADAPRIPCFTHGLEQGSTLRLGQLEARIFHTPGHTRGGIVYVVEDAAFTGDALFGAGCGRLFEGTPELLHHSLNVTLGALDDGTRVFCGHEYTQKNLAFAANVEEGNADIARRRASVDALREAGLPAVPSTMGEERRTNPFLRCAERRLHDQLAARYPSAALDTPVAVFTLLRSLRDRF